MSRATEEPPVVNTIENHNRPRHKHIMAGAEVPPLPDRQRPRAHVVKDHAIRLWGLLRDVAVLDSNSATEIIGKALDRLLDAWFDDSAKYKKRITELERAGSMLLGKIKQSTSRPPRGDELQTGNQRHCAICNRPLANHTEKCPIGTILEFGKSQGFTVGISE